jgi:tripartite-type tricarboxylate transporter receptor subunit TctC
VRDSGKVIALAVTGPKRSNSAPEVPTFRELGYEGFDDLYVANGLLAPIGTPAGVVQALNRELVKANSSGPIRDRLVSSSYEPGVIAAEQYGAMIDRELKQWGAIVKATGVQVKT